MIFSPFTDYSLKWVFICKYNIYVYREGGGNSTCVLLLYVDESVKQLQASNDGDQMDVGRHGVVRLCGSTT